MIVAKERKCLIVQGCSDFTCENYPYDHNCFLLMWYFILPERSPGGRKEKVKISYHRSIFACKTSTVTRDEISGSLSITVK